MPVLVLFSFFIHSSYEFFLEVTFNLQSAASFQTLFLTYPFYPTVSDAAIFGCVLNVDCVIGSNVFVHYFQGNVADSDSSRIQIINTLFYGVSRQILCSSSRETKNHCEITFFNSAQRNWQIMFRSIRNVVF